jgi:hypothetical protein
VERGIKKDNLLIQDGTAAENENSTTKSEMWAGNQIK